MKLNSKTGQWDPDFPLYIEEIRYTDEEKTPHIALQAFNQSGKTIQGAVFRAILYDSKGKEAGKAECEYGNLNILDGRTLPAGKYFPVDLSVTDSAERPEKVKLQWQSITFIKNEILENPVYHPIDLEEQRELTEENFPYYSYMRRNLSAVSKCRPGTGLFYPVDYKGYRLCICGHPVRKGEKCSFCGAEQEALAEYLSDENLIRLQKKAVIERAAQRSRRTQAVYNRSAESLYAAAVRTKKIADEIPEGTYSGVYKEAEEMFEQIRGWKDARLLADSCRDASYRHGMYCLENDDPDKALQWFSDIWGWKDTETQMKKARLLQIEKQTENLKQQILEQKKAKEAEEEEKRRREIARQEAEAASEAFRRKLFIGLLAGFALVMAAAVVIIVF